MKKIISVLLSVLMATVVFTSLTLCVSAATAEDTVGAATSGTLENGTRWSFDAASGKISFTNPDNPGYGVSGDVKPWDPFKKDIKIVELEDTIGYIGRYSFLEYHELEKVILPAGEVKIYDAAFSHCEKLSSIDFTNVKHIGNDAFSYCKSLTKVHCAAELEHLNSDRIKAADVTGEGLDISDATAIQMYLAEYENTFKIGETVIYDEYELPFIPVK